MKSNRFRWLAGAFLVLFILTLAGVFTWRYVFNPCEVQEVNQASDSLVIQSKMYDQVYQSAVSGDRTSLEYPVTVLQQTFMNTQSVMVPVCMQRAKDELLSYMSTVIYAFRAYSAREPNDAVRELVQQSNEHYDNFVSEMEVVRECAPFCFR